MATKEADACACTAPPTVVPVIVNGYVPAKVVLAWTVSTATPRAANGMRTCSNTSARLGTTLVDKSTSSSMLPVLVMTNV